MSNLPHVLAHARLSGRPMPLPGLTRIYHLQTTDLLATHLTPKKRGVVLPEAIFGSDVRGAERQKQDVVLRTDRMGRARTREAVCVCVFSCTIHSTCPPTSVGDRLSINPYYFGGVSSNDTGRLQDYFLY